MASTSLQCYPGVSIVYVGEGPGCGNWSRYTSNVLPYSPRTAARSTARYLFYTKNTTPHSLHPAKMAAPEWTLSREVSKETLSTFSSRCTAIKLMRQWDISLLTRRLVLDQSDKAWVGNAVACIHSRVFGGCLRQQRGLEQDVIWFAWGLLRLEQTSSLLRLTIFHCLWSSVWNQLHRNSPRYIHGHACTLHKRRQKHCFGSV